MARRLEEEINRFLSDQRLSLGQRETLKRFDEDLVLDNYSLWRRRGLFFHLRDLGMFVKKPFEEVTVQDLKRYVAESQKRLAESTMAMRKASIKRFYKWLNGGEEYPKNVKWMKTSRRNNHFPVKSPNDLVSKEEVKKLIGVAESLRDKAVISVLYDSAARAGEFLGLKVGSVQFDNYGAILYVDGKTGMRRIRLTESVPYLQLWIGNHPDRDNPEAPLWWTGRGGLKSTQFGTLLHKYAGEAGVKKRVHPHLFRHSRLTELSNILSEHQLKVFAGWTQDSRQASIYVHLSGEDLDADLLTAFGMVEKEEVKKESPLKPKKCFRCDFINPADSKFCSRCGIPLDVKTALQLEEARDTGDDMMNKLLKNQEFQKFLSQKLSEFVNNI